VTGNAAREEESLYLVAELSRVRLQGIEGLSSLDSLEVAWATAEGAPLSAFGRISSTPRGGDSALFVMTVSAVQPPGRTGGAPTDTTAATPAPGTSDTTAIP
jgi:hypothetical protein